MSEASPLPSEMLGADAKLSVAAYREAKATAAAASSFTAKIIRDWTLNELVPEAIKRMFDIGMGVQTFNTPTMAGNVVQIEAPPAVQRAALHDLISIGLPAQIGLVDDEGNAQPGVIALGEYDMVLAQQAVHGPRMLGGVGDAIAHELDESDRIAEVPPSSGSTYELPADHEMVVVEEGIGTQAAVVEDAPPAPISPVPTIEQIVLARHRARMKQQKHKPLPAAPSSEVETNGTHNGNGSNGNGAPDHLRD